MVVENDLCSISQSMMKLMGLAVKQGDEVVVAANGPQEDAAIAAAEAFLKENL